MRKTYAFLFALALGGCSTVSDLSPVASDSPREGKSQTTATVEVSYPRFGDNDPHDWKSTKPWSHAVHGVDVSKYQRDVNWPTAKSSGVSFAFLKATEGADRVDSKFARNWQATKAAGIPRGGYHFYYFCRTAAEQARWFIANVPRDRSSLPPVLDMEWNPQSPSCKLRPDPSTVRSEMRIWLDMVAKHYGKKPVIYTPIDFYEDNGLAAFEGYPFWLRSVANHPGARYGAKPWVFWQYTGTGVVPGIQGDADINVFAGDERAWKKWVAAATR